MRLSSKTSDKLQLILDFLEKAKIKKFLLTWDRHEDPHEGLVLLPILEVR